MAEFAGRLVRPQQWPEELDYRDKQVVIIGSGATAVTLVTDQIDSFTPTGIRLRSGPELAADIVVSATGLFAGLINGVQIVVNGRKLNDGVMEFD